MHIGYAIFCFYYVSMFLIHFWYCYKQVDIKIYIVKCNNDINDDTLCYKFIPTHEKYNFSILIDYEEGKYKNNQIVKMYINNKNKSIGDIPKEIIDRIFNETIIIIFIIHLIDTYYRNHILFFYHMLKIIYFNKKIYIYRYKSIDNCPICNEDKHIYTHYLCNEQHIICLDCYIISYNCYYRCYNKLNYQKIFIVI